jgi:ABC-type molybdenum transport system ATPase subunit/photorepair protein PhrA
VAGGSLSGTVGAGKTTLLKCIAGEQEPTYGTITLARGTRIGRVEQEVPPVLRNLTLRDSIGAMLPDEQLLSRGWEVDALLNTGFGSTPGSWSTSSIFRPADIHPSRISQRRQSAQSAADSLYSCSGVTWLSAVPLTEAATRCVSGVKSWAS